MPFLDKLVAYWEISNEPTSSAQTTIPEYFGNTFPLQMRYTYWWNGSYHWSWETDAPYTAYQFDYIGPGTQTFTLGANGWGTVARSAYAVGFLHNPPGLGSIQQQNTFFRTTDSRLLVLAGSNTGSFTWAFLPGNLPNNASAIYIEQRNGVAGPIDFSIAQITTGKSTPINTVASSSGIAFVMGTNILYLNGYVSGSVVASYDADNQKMIFQDTHGHIATASYSASYHGSTDITFNDGRRSTISDSSNLPENLGGINRIFRWNRLLTPEEVIYLNDGMAFGFVAPMIYYKNDDLLEVSNVYETASIQSQSYFLDGTGKFYLNGTVTEDPTMTEQFNLSIDGNLRVRKLHERYT